MSCTITFYFLSPFFFYNDTAPTEIYTLSLHDALPIAGGDLEVPARRLGRHRARAPGVVLPGLCLAADRKSTRLNSSHRCISYAVFCLKKKNNNKGTNLI